MPEVYLYEKDTRAVNYTDSSTRSLSCSVTMDNERSIPSLVDDQAWPAEEGGGSHLSQEESHKKEIKVAQLAGSVAEVSAYHGRPA